MSEQGHQVVSLHGSKDATERDRTIDAFRDGKYKVLITTNVVARGIDILQVNMVVNYDLPMTVDNKPDVETYLHRIGLSPLGSEFGSVTEFLLQGERDVSDGRVSL